MSFFEHLRSPKPATAELTPEQEAENDARTEIRKFEIPALVALEKITNDIESGSIGTVIGIDGSGRLPALLVGRIIKNRYQELGHSRIEQKFFRGYTGYRGDGYEETRKDKITTFSEALRLVPLDKKRKVLIVEDFIHSGETVIPFLDVLRREGYEVEVMSLGVKTPKDKITFYDSVEWDDLENTFSAGNMSVSSFHKAKSDLERKSIPLHSGGGGDEMWGTSAETGVTKKDGDKYNPYSTIDHHQDRNIIIVARDELSKVTEKVLESYRQNLATKAGTAI